MKTHENPTDRNQVLRSQLVAMPTVADSGKLPSRNPLAENSHLQHKRPRRKARMVFALAAVGVGLMVVGQLNLTVQSAQASEVLRATAEKSLKFTDLAPETGQYLLVKTHASWAEFSSGIKPRMVPQNIDVYIPSDPDQAWVLDRDWDENKPRREVIHAQQGNFYGTPWSIIGLDELEALPRDGKALYEHFNSQYQGGSASRNEDNFVRITDLLKTGLVPADLRAGLYDALALIPGVTTHDNQKNFDGTTGTAIGRTEALRGGEHTEIIIDPDSGLVIGERKIATIALFGLGINDVTSETAIDYLIVDSAPK